MRASAVVLSRQQQIREREQERSWALRAVDEVRRLIVSVRSGWMLGRRPWVALGLGAVTALVYWLLGNRSIGPDLWHSGSVYASLPITTELRRLPMSLLLPTPFLPEWGAIAQLIAVIGIGELILGRWVTLLVALGGHTVATLSARMAIELGPARFTGLTPIVAHTLDTGPSAAAVAAGACLLVTLRDKRCAALLFVALVLAALFTPGIDGFEHLVGLAFGVVAGLGIRWARRSGFGGPTIPV